MKRVGTWFLSGLLWCASTTAMSDASEPGWQVLAQERGITVSVREEPGRELPTFRGQGVIEGDVLLVLAVVLDAVGSMEWAEGADEVRVVKTIDARNDVLYTRTDTPWPVSDRDMYMTRKTEVVKPGEEFRLSVKCMKGEKEREDTIRILDCDSHFVLRKVDANHTSIDYMVNVDPRGSLPKFLIKWASKKVPFDTLVNLEAFAKKERARYQKDIELWASAR
jgi:hypothetical protein